MENAEEVLQCLDSFSKLKPKDIPRELEEYLCFVARTGDPVYQWSLIKFLFREKLLHVLTDFHDNSPGLEIPPCPNVDPFNYDTLKNCLLEKIEAFSSAPFTVQRICELLTTPRKQYNRIDKYMRAIEKNILVVSTREPGQRRSESENGDPLDIVVNGDASGVHIEIDLDDSAWREADSTIADTTTITAGSGDFNLISETADSIATPTASIETVISLEPVENTDQTSITLINENTEAPILEQTVTCIESVSPIEPVQIVNEITVDETIVAEIDNSTDPIEVMNVNVELEESATKTEFETKTEDIEITIDYIEQPQVDIASVETHETHFSDVELTVDQVEPTATSDVEPQKSEIILENSMEKENNLLENILTKTISSPKALEVSDDIKLNEDVVQEVEIPVKVDVISEPVDVAFAEIVKEEDTVKDVVDNIVEELVVSEVPEVSASLEEAALISENQSQEVTTEKPEPDVYSEKPEVITEKIKLDVNPDKTDVPIIDTFVEDSKQEIVAPEKIIGDVIVENISDEIVLNTVVIECEIQSKIEGEIPPMHEEVESTIEVQYVKPEEAIIENITEVIESLPADENITELVVEPENMISIIPEPQETAMEVEDSDTNPPDEPMDQ